MLPLAGITVVALEQAVAAPFATRQLADLGARVIKVERPGAGDFARGYDRQAKGMSSHFVWTNRSKESLTLDLKTAVAQEILEKLLAKADVFIHNLAPGAVERLGFPAERLRAAYPRLIICSISGYGATGPYRHKKAYDMLIQAEAGLISITGTAETPSKAGISAADIAAGMYAFSGILTALLARGQTGEGTTLEISMLEALGEWMGFPMYFSLDGPPPPRAGGSHAAIAPYGPFAAGDGGTVILGIQNEREWARFCEMVLEKPEMAADPRFAGNSARVAHRAEMRQAIAAMFATLTREEALARLDAAQIANAAARTMDEFINHPQLEARNRWRRVGSPVGELPALLPPVTMEGVEPLFGPIPALGEHTELILEEIGVDTAVIAQLRQSQII